MANVIDKMLSKYEIQNFQDEKNALKEIIQEIILCGLSRGNFFDVAAFYGGTALRIFYDLDRFSEDLDFTLIKKEENFNLSNYFQYVKNETESYGINTIIESKEKNIETNISSAYLKGDTKEIILKFFPNDLNAKTNNMLGNIKIKFEIETNPPIGATYENKIKLLPSPHKVKLYDKESLFAGKLAAILCRNWKSRIKGRDLYDYIFYLSNSIKVNVDLLRYHLVSTNYIDKNFNLNENSLKELLKIRFNEINYNSAKEDVTSFIKDKNKLMLWNKEFFLDITNSAKFV